MPNVWIVNVEGDYVYVGQCWEMYPALVWVGTWGWMQDFPNGRSLFYGEVNDQVKAELESSPNVVVHSAVLQE